MSTTSATRSTIRGSLRTASAMLVSGPVGTRVTEPGRVRQDRVDDEVDGVPRVQGDVAGGVGLGQHRPVQPGLAVDVARHAQGAQQRPGAPGGERHAGDAADAGDRDRVAGDLLEGLVPGDGGHREQLDLRAAVGEQQRDGVVVPGVAVEEDLAGHGGSLSEVGVVVGEPFRRGCHSWGSRSRVTGVIRRGAAAPHGVRGGRVVAGSVTECAVPRGGGDRTTSETVEDQRRR